MYPLAGGEGDGDATGEGDGDGDGLGVGDGVGLAAAVEGLEAAGVCELASDVLPQPVRANSRTTAAATLIARGIIPDVCAGATRMRGRMLT